MSNTSADRRQTAAERDNSQQSSFDKQSNYKENGKEKNNNKKKYTAHISTNKQQRQISQKLAQKVFSNRVLESYSTSFSCQQANLTALPGVSSPGGAYLTLACHRWSLPTVLSLSLDACLHFYCFHEFLVPWQHCLIMKRCIFLYEAVIPMQTD